MTSPWRIRTIVTGTGERLPLLLDRASGVPLFDPTVFAVTEVRARNRAANTIPAASGGAWDRPANVWSN
jgi:hypothetical protein